MSGTGAPTPGAVRALELLLGFLGITALLGGIGLLSGIDAVSPPAEWLVSIPVVDSWILPGLVLGVVFGLGSLVTLWGVRTRVRWRWLAPVERLTGHHWAWSATILLGVGQSVWIALELLWLPEVSFLQPLYGAVGVALVLLPWTASARRHLAADD